MIRIYQITDEHIEELEDYEIGCWIQLIDPNETEIQEIVDPLLSTERRFRELKKTRITDAL